ncbi:hypothetical protein AZF37_04950 [endosymbiont 'TC1' of Trimyema compressum]|uniref:biotin--[acetyl-CoA-carboxylase] ligase n=1 Tax=endosymbiont 'TC1' of Trimyema compressum TaxID=243899 RepID=UPI0007F16F71|nr:biotin--[acetyl-CoA-carboxylase] ligase [endosymbiont 'TC1' of Trimyema compressum]AMP20607.1 hypothetical protein AZF37_04950 [endosymbiont 'TC1' of Trimyema compressum]
MLKDDILLKLEKNPGRLITGGGLAKELSVSRTAVWKAINTLKFEGYAIESLKNKGYRLNQNNDVLSEYLIKSALTTNFLGNTFEILETVDSTNQYLKKMNFLLIDEGYIVLANEQTAGKGRRGRIFCSPKKEGIYLSLFLKPTFPISDLHFLTLGIAVAVAKAVEKVCGFRPQVKWVNDLYYNYKKICGILTEATLSTENNAIDGVVIGVGINTGTVNKNVATIATSVEEITGKKGFRNHLVSEILNYFEVIYELLQSRVNKGKEYILNEYKKRLFLVRHQVWIIDNKMEYLVTVLDIDKEGSLVVRNDKNEVIHLRTGEISLKLEGVKDE